MHAAIATGFVLGLAASLNGCGWGSTCPITIEGPTKTINFTPQGEVLIVDIGEDFDAEVITAPEVSAATVTVKVPESLEAGMRIEYYDHSAHQEGRKELTVSMVPALGDIGCDTGVKVTVILPAPAASFFGGRGTSTVDVLTAGASVSTGFLTVGLLNGSDTGISSERRGRLVVNSVRAANLSVSTGSTYLEDRLNGATLEVLAGEVSDRVTIQQAAKRSSIELKDLTTQSASIRQDVDAGSLTGMRSETCSISYSGAGTISTEVNQAVDCTATGESSAAGKVTITGDAAKTGSCFESAQGAQVVV